MPPPEPVVGKQEERGSFFQTRPGRFHAPREHVTSSSGSGVSEGQQKARLTAAASIGVLFFKFKIQDEVGSVFGSRSSLGFQGAVLSRAE